jgi:hypothetical protein
MMRLITVLNRCTEFKRFVIEESRFDEHGEIMVSLRSRKNSKGESSCCGQLSPTYDTAAEARLFEFIPFWGFPVFLVIACAGLRAKPAAGSWWRRSLEARASTTSPL